MSLSIELIQGKASIGHTEHPAGQSEYQPLDLLLNKEMKRLAAYFLISFASMDYGTKAHRRENEHQSVSAFQHHKLSAKLLLDL